MTRILNLSGYLFVPLTSLQDWQGRLRSLASLHGIKGTILLSEEGINVAVAGVAEEAQAFIRAIQAFPEFSTLTFKVSESDFIPFKRFIVKIKAEIIRFLQADSTPLPPASPTHLSPEQLKAWLDEGRDITLLDTRNDYEIAIGTFKQAVTLPIHYFTQLPKSVANLPKAALEKPVVMFCTGGVRCEKAAPWLLHQGVREVYQLDGGILNYFKACGDAHYDGECFVFDERVSLTSKQEASGAIICEHCQFPVSKAQQQEASFQQPKHCPHCVLAPNTQETQSTPQQSTSA